MMFVGGTRLGGAIGHRNRHQSPPAAYLTRCLESGRYAVTDSLRSPGRAPEHRDVGSSSTRSSRLQAVRSSSEARQTCPPLGSPDHMDSRDWPTELRTPSRVRAENEVGWGPFSAESAPVTPAGPPLAPSISAQSTNPGQVTLSWSAPGDNGSPITGYQVSVNGGPPSQVSGPPFSPHIIGGLSNSTAYSFRVRAVNDVGAGAWSGARSVTTWGPPSAVSTPSTSAGNGQVAVSWNAPASNGSPIIEYEVDISPGASATTAARNRTFTGLSNGTTYTFRVRARNAVGWGPWGGSRSATPSAPKTATVSRGAFENVPGCSGPSCYHLRLTASGIPQGSFTARCFNDTGWWHEQSITIGSAGTYNADLNCIYGFPGNDVWVEIVGQIITPRYRWPN